MFRNLYKASPIFSFLMVGSLLLGQLNRFFGDSGISLVFDWASLAFLMLSLVAVFSDIQRDESTPESVFKNYVLGVNLALKSIQAFRGIKKA